MSVGDSMSIRLAAGVVAAFLYATTSAQTISLQGLTGVWSYESYAEVETPDERTPVGARMDFRPDGTIVMTLSTGSAEGTFTLEGDTIHYSDANGPQEWKVRSYEPGKSLVVEYMRALLYFEKVDAE
jgi:hypothetical protein